MKRNYRHIHKPQKSCCKKSLDEILQEIHPQAVKALPNILMSLAIMAEFMIAPMVPEDTENNSENQSKPMES